MNMNNFKKFELKKNESKQVFGGRWVVTNSYTDSQGVTQVYNMYFDYITDAVNYNNSHPGSMMAGNTSSVDYNFQKA